MQKTHKVLLYTAALLVGCAASPAVSQLVVPPARAQSAPQRWEYQCERMTESITPVANKLGQQGWELVAAAGYGYGTPVANHDETMVWCFKRPLP